MTACEVAQMNACVCVLCVFVRVAPTLVSLSCLTMKVVRGFSAVQRAKKTRKDRVLKQKFDFVHTVCRCI